MREIIASIKLAPGQVGYYDEYSRIHLTIARPRADIYAGTNCAQIRRSIKAGRIVLESGTLGPEIAPVRIVKTPTGIKIVSNKDAEHAPIVADATPVAESTVDLTKEVEVVPVVEEVVEAQPVVEEIPAEDEITEETTEEVAEEAAEKVEEKTSKRRTRRKKAEKAE